MVQGVPAFPFSGDFAGNLNTFNLLPRNSALMHTFNPLEAHCVRWPKMATFDRHMPTVALIGTLDTKQEEYQYAITYLEDKGCAVYMFDVSTRPSSAMVTMGQGSILFKPHDLIASVSGSKQENQELFSWERARLREVLHSACCSQLTQLQSQTSLDAIASFGGSQNTSFATAVMRSSEFPIGLPKFVLSTMASGDISRYVGECDIAVMPSIGDISGTMNAITRLTLRTALSAIHGMAQEHRSAELRTNLKQDTSQKPMIGLSMFGVTTVAVTQISDILSQNGFQPVAFHATGSGGKTMERLIRQGFFRVVIDLTTTELCDHLFDGVLTAGPDRLTAAAACGVPQIVSVGALDMINYGPLASLPPRYNLKSDNVTTDRNGVQLCEDGTKVYQHNSEVTLVRVSPQQSSQVGAYLVNNIARGLGEVRKGKEAPVHILLPTRGISAMDAEHGVWEDVRAREHLFSAIQDTLKQHQGKDATALHMSVTEHSLHINSPKFAHIVATQAIELAKLSS